VQVGDDQPRERHACFQHLIAVDDEELVGMVGKLSSRRR